MTERTKSTTRRSFFWTAGAALSAPLSIAAAAERPEPNDDATERLARLEDLDSILDLHRAFARHVNAGAHGDAANLFADPTAVRLDASIRGLFAEGFGERDVIELGADRTTAAARIRCTIRVETPIESSSTLAQMARLQGEGVVRSTEQRVLETACIKRAGVWRIERAAYRPA